MTAIIVDTNVILVANRQHQDISPACVAACAKRLQAVMQTGRLALDDGFRILNEYLHKTTPKTGNRPGDAFVKWALRNNANPQRVTCVKLDNHAERGFESFPEDPDLVAFDHADRKFVAVSCAHPDTPPILQAADSKWLDWAEPLSRAGVAVEFICRDDIARFHANKFGS